jgi:glycerophosphoryl diester phosphodiesterase
MNLRNKFIAHRGLHDSKIIPENSLLAFKNAVDKNYAIEFDVTISKDNQAIIFHDDDLFRLCNKKEKIEELEYKVLKQLKLYDTNEHIPLFSEMLEIVDAKIPLIIEIKKHRNIGILENIIVEYLKNYKGEYYICSFEKDILFWFKNNTKNINIGLIFEFESKKIFKYSKILFLYKYYKTKPNFVSLDYHLYENSSIYNFCKKKNLPVIFWTISSKELSEKLFDKAAGLIFEKIIP